jgi:hypothetical protein
MTDPETPKNYGSADGFLGGLARSRRPGNLPADAGYQFCRVKSASNGRTGGMPVGHSALALLAAL